MVKYLDFEAECGPSSLPRIGGGACLPVTCEWPKDGNGKPMMHLLALPANMVNDSSGCRLPENYCVSVFIPYRKNSIEHVIELARKPDAACIIAHEVSTKIRQECESPLLPPHEIKIDSDEEADEEDEFSDEIESKIGGGPVWLQDRIDAPGCQFLLQLVGSAFNQYWPSHKGIFMGGICYFFIRDDCDYSQSSFG